HVGGVHGHPAVIREEHLGATVLRLRDGGAARSERLVAEGRWGYPDAVDVAGGHAHRSHETDEEAVEVGTLSAEVPGLEHGLDVADAAAAHLGLAVRIVENPVVHGPHLVEIGRLATSDLDGSVSDDAIGRHQIGGPSPRFEARRILAGLDLPRP